MKKKSKPNSVVAKVVERIAAKTRGKKTHLPFPPLLQQIIADTKADQPPFLPVENPEFAQCSKAIAQFRLATNSHSRPLRLPSLALPPL